MNANRKFLEKVVSSGLEGGIIRSADLVRHATATVLAHHLPADLTAKVLDAGLSSGKMNPDVIVKTLGAAEFARHVPTGVLWACVSECAKRALSATEAPAKEAAPSKKAPAAKSGAAAKSAPQPAVATKSAPVAAATAAAAKNTPAPSSRAGAAAGKGTSLGKGTSSTVTTSASRSQIKRSPLSPGARLSPVPEPQSPFDDDETNVRADHDGPDGKDDWEDVPIATDYDILEEGDAPDALVAQAAGEWGSKEPPETLPGSAPGSRSN